MSIKSNMPKQKIVKRGKKERKPRINDPATYENAIKSLLEIRKEKIGGLKSAYDNLLATIQDALNTDERIILTQHEYEKLLKRKKKN